MTTQTTNPRRVRVNTSFWRFANITSARPCGYGRWAFSFGGEMHFYTGEYAECRERAVQEAAAMGATEVELRP